MELINWNDFQKIDIRIGTITKAEVFIGARNPAYKLWIDLGDELGIKKSSAQITENYSVDGLVGKQVQCIVNFPKKQIGHFMSEVLVTGYTDGKGHIVLASVVTALPNGAKLH